MGSAGETEQHARESRSPLLLKLKFNSIYFQILGTWDRREFTQIGQGHLSHRAMYQSISPYDIPTSGQDRLVPLGMQLLVQLGAREGIQAHRDTAGECGYCCGLLMWLLVLSVLLLGRPLG